MQTTIIDAGNLGLAANKVQASGFGHITNRTLVAPVGRCRLQLSDNFGRGFLLRDGKGQQLAPLDGDWSGNLATGFTEFVVASN